MDSWKRELTDKDETAAEEWKVITLEVKKLNGNEVIEEIVHPGNGDTVTIQEIPDIQLEGLRRWTYQHKLGTWLWWKS